MDIREAEKIAPGFEEYYVNKGRSRDVWGVEISKSIPYAEPDKANRCVYHIIEHSLGGIKTITAAVWKGNTQYIGQSITDESAGDCRGIMHAEIEHGVAKIKVGLGDTEKTLEVRLQN